MLEVRTIRTNELKKYIQSSLKTVCDNASYKRAVNDKLYPHIVFTFKDINTGDLTRHDISVDIDVWDKDNGTVDIDEMCDSIEDMFNFKNHPQDKILPTFYLESRNDVTDDDKTIEHRLIRIVVQNYERR